MLKDGLSKDSCYFLLRNTESDYNKLNFCIVYCYIHIKHPQNLHSSYFPGARDIPFRHHHIFEDKVKNINSNYSFVG